MRVVYIVCAVVVIFSTFFQFREYLQTPKEDSALRTKRRNGCIIQAIVLVILVGLNVNRLFG